MAHICYKIMQPKKGGVMFFQVRDRKGVALIIVLALLGAFSLFLDLRDLWFGTTDLNKHIPFLLTVIMGAGIWAIMKTERHAEQCPKCRDHILGELEKQSYLNPENLPYDRFKDGSIG